MPYAADLHTNMIIHVRHSGAPVHITDVVHHRVGAQHLATLTGHAANGSGIAYHDTIAANAHVAEADLSGALVEYHGGATGWHGQYRVAGPCESCETCAADLSQQRYRLLGNRFRLEHVRHSSITVIQPSCKVCY